MQKNKEKESNIRKMKAQLVFLCISLMLLTSACGKADGKESFGSSLKPETAEVYGDSVNMRGGGLAEGDESGLFYVWDGKLMYQENHKEAEVLDEYGAEYLCLTPKTLYYVSRDEEGTRGIYARENGASKKRELLLTTEARYLYEYDGFLYYINYPQGADICRLKIKDNSVETLAEGRFDSLLLTEDALFYRDYETKQYFRRAFLEDYTLKEAELWISYTEDIMPILDGEWIYYDLGDYFYHYKVSLTDRAMMGRHPKASTDMLIANGQKYEINRKTDLNTGRKVPLRRNFT